MLRWGAAVRLMRIFRPRKQVDHSLAENLSTDKKPPVPTAMDTGGWDCWNRSLPRLVPWPSCWLPAHLVILAAIRSPMPHDFPLVRSSELTNSPWGAVFLSCLKQKRAGTLFRISCPVAAGGAVRIPFLVFVNSTNWKFLITLSGHIPREFFGNWTFL